MKNTGKTVPLIIGAFIVLMGISIITGISFPIFRILFGLFFIYLGFVVITKKSRFCCGRRNQKFFSDDKVSTTNDTLDKEYSVVFGKATYDFTGVTADSGNKIIKINIAFGAAVIKINKDNPVKVTVNSAFSGAKTPDGTSISFGSHDYTTASFSQAKNHLLIDVDVAFGSVEII